MYANVIGFQWPVVDYVRMEATLPLEQMNALEKLRAIEILWDDLCRNGEDIPVPEWHRQALTETKKRSQDGLENPTDWETAKGLLRYL